MYNYPEYQEGLGLELLDYEELFENTQEKIILNDLSATNLADKAHLKHLAISEYDKDCDIIDNKPSCLCGAIKEVEKLGHHCPECDTEVQYDYDREIEPNLWIRVPEGINGFIKPRVYEFFYSRLKFSHWNGFEWLLKPRYEDPKPAMHRGVKFVQLCKEVGLERGYHNVVANMDLLITVTLRSLPAGKRKEQDIKFIELNQGKMLTNILPAPNKVLLILSNTSTGIYTDNTLKPAMEAILAATSLSAKDKPLRAIGNKCAVISEQFYHYYQSALKAPLNSKGGLWRGMVYGTRSNFSFRTVISSEHGVHHYEEMKIPYTEFVVTFELHICNLLMNRYGYHPKKALRLINKYTKVIHPFMKHLIQELIDNTENKEGFWCQATRYPSLNINSTSAFRIVGVTDKGATTISVLRLKAPNADFDGDNMSGQIALDHQTREMFKRRRCHYAIHSTTKYREFNNHMELSDTTIATMHNALEQSDIECGLLDPYKDTRQFKVA